jgi:lysophospholipase L1-like esterase
MNRRTRIMFAASSLLSVALGGLAVGPSPAWADAGETTHYYLSLGDSLAESFQPNGGLTHGYTEAVFKAIRGDSDQLRHVKLGCGGETVASMIDTTVAGFCRYPAGAFDTQSQLDVAVDFLAAHPGKVAVITIDIAGNDNSACMDPTTLLLDRECLDQAFPAALADLSTVLTTLQQAAPGVPIVGMNYYDPFLGLWVLGPDARAVALHNAPIVADLNAQLTATYQSAGVPVADVASAFDSVNFTDTVDTKEWGEVPVNVANVCRWTWFCDNKYAFDVHPNSEGYQVIADTFLAVIEHPAIHIDAQMIRHLICERLFGAPRHYTSSAERCPDS